MAHAGSAIGPARLVGDFHHRDAGCFQQFQILCGITSDLVSGGEQEYGDVYPSLGQIAGHDEAIAAIITPAGQNADFSRTFAVDLFQKGMGGASPGIFHEHASRYAEIIDCLTVQDLHLVGCNDDHGNPQRAFGPVQSSNLGDLKCAYQLYGVPDRTVHSF